MLCGHAAAASAASVPVVRCVISRGVPGPTRSTPPSLSVAPSASRLGLVAYTNSYDFLLAPSGMRCSGLLAANGGTSIAVWRRGERQPGQHSREDGLTLDVEPGCVGCMAAAACPFFPAFARGLGFPCASGLPAGEHATRLRSNIELFKDPPGVTGSGFPSGGADPANGLVGLIGGRSGPAVYRATCTLPSTETADCTASLNDVIRRLGG